MMKSLCLFIIFLSFLCSVSILAKPNLNLPVKVLGNESYYFYKVKGGESLNGIAQKLGITVNDILLYNPSASQGVTKKQLLFFPVSDFSPTKKENTTVQVPTSKVLHVVKKGQSLYGISKIYNVTVDNLVAANPGAYTNLKEGDVIVIPVNQSISASSVTGVNEVFHTIAKGESMYSIAKQYNTTVENLLKLNPGIYPNHFIEGDVIKICPNTPEQISVKTDVKQMTHYVAKKADTFESIASANHISVKQLKDANPDLKKIKNGSVVYIPKNGVTTKTVSSSDATVHQLEQTYSDKIADIATKAHQTKKDGVINVAMVLPFQLQKENPPRQAYLYTDFYKGFLLAVDSIGKHCDRKININVYDTQHNLNVTDSILALPSMKNMDAIIAPSEPKQLERCNQFGIKNNVFVINCFSSKNEDYASNPQIIQLNMPSSYLAAAVNELISSDFKDYEIVFLKDPSEDDNDVISEVMQYLKANNFKTHFIDVFSTIGFETISSYMDPGSNYLFIPTSSSKQFFLKFSKALTEVKGKRFDCEVRLLGHPEYLVMKDQKSTLQKINTYVYSRFFVANEKRGAEIERKFKAAYHENMLPTTPSLGILGFDLGTYIITTLSSDGSFITGHKYFDGVQMDIDLQRSSNWGGYINKCVELVHFSGNKVSERIIK